MVFFGIVPLGILDDEGCAGSVAGVSAVEAVLKMRRVVGLGILEVALGCRCGVEVWGFGVAPLRTSK